VDAAPGGILDDIGGVVEGVRVVEGAEVGVLLLKPGAEFGVVDDGANDLGGGAGEGVLEEVVEVEVVAVDEAEADFAGSAVRVGHGGGVLSGDGLMEKTDRSNVRSE